MVRKRRGWMGRGCISEDERGGRYDFGGRLHGVLEAVVALAQP